MKGNVNVIVPSHATMAMAAAIIKVAQDDLASSNERNRATAKAFFDSWWYEFLVDYISEFNVSEGYLEALKPHA